MHKQYKIKELRLITKVVDTQLQKAAKISNVVGDLLEGWYYLKRKLFEFTVFSMKAFLEIILYMAFRHYTVLGIGQRSQPPLKIEGFHNALRTRYMTGCDNHARHLGSIFVCTSKRVPPWIESRNLCTPNPLPTHTKKCLWRTSSTSYYNHLSMLKSGISMNWYRKSPT